MRVRVCGLSITANKFAGGVVEDHYKKRRKCGRLARTVFCNREPQRRFGITGMISEGWCERVPGKADENQPGKGLGAYF